MTGLMRGQCRVFHTVENASRCDLLSVGKIPFLGLYLAAGAGVAAEGNLGSHMSDFTSGACAGTSHGDRERPVAISGEPQWHRRSRGACAGCVRCLTLAALPLQSRAARTLGYRLLF